MPSFPTSRMLSIVIQSFAEFRQGQINLYTGSGSVKMMIRASKLRFGKPVGLVMYDLSILTHSQVHFDNVGG